ncbi:MAG: GNAT family N-acetyltransferase [Sarcina sp.]
MLKDFKRYQEINKVWHIEAGKLNVYTVNEKYDWNEEFKLEIIKRLRNILKRNGFIIGYYNSNKLKGFVAIDGEVFGSKKQYRELKYIHVSHEMRGRGVGKILFNLMTDKLRELGVGKVYMSANSSEESQMFYRKRGCTIAKEIKQDCVEEEPYDIQLEYCLE